MLTTPLCDLFGIEVPIILAPMGTCRPSLLRRRPMPADWAASARCSAVSPRSNATST